MKRVFLTMTAMLSISAAFVSCADKEVFDQAAVEKAKVLETEKQYKEDFVKHFGEVAPDQSWDFSQVNYLTEEQSTQTRAAGRYQAPSWNELGLLGSFLSAVLFETNYPNVTADEAEVKSLIASMPVVEWPYDYAQIKLHPFYAQGKSSNNYHYLGVKYKDIWGFDEHNGLCFHANQNEWTSIISKFNLFTEMNMNSYASVNTTNMIGVDGFEWFVATSNTSWRIPTRNIQSLTTCKMFYVNGNSYVALDCDGDNDYSDLICWVEDCSPSKRYMVEDLGSKGDFDFNDIVFDVVKKPRGGYECIVRAMGGTLEFTIKVGKTTWSKAGAKYDTNTMYNTMEGDYDLNKEYAKFDVAGWVPEANDVTVTVKGNEGEFVLPFPEDGEIPFMVATSIGKAWSKERVNVNTIGWFGSSLNDGKIEVVEE